MATETLAVNLLLNAGQYNREALRAATATGQIGTQAQVAGTRTKAMGQRMKGLASSGGGLLALAGGAFAAKQAFDGTVGAFANFDDAMNQSLAIMGDVSDEMRDEMSDAARDVAKATTFSAEEAAEAYFFLASAGLDATQSIGAMPQVAQFAQAGMFDLATATDLATDAQSALGLTSEDAGENLESLTRVTDVLVKANSEANATVEQFATSLTQKAGGALRSVEKDLEEGVAVLAVFADQGIKGERGGTILRATLDGLSSNARDNADAFSELGVSVFDSEENMRNMADITADLEAALGPMTVQQREAALAQLGFNRRSREGILALMGNSEAVREYEEELRNAAGTTEEVADKQLESLKNQFELLKSEMADVGLEIGEGLFPAFSSLVQAAGPVVQVLGLIAQGYTDTTNAVEGLGTQAEESGDAVLGVAGRLSRFASQPALLVFFDMIKDAVDDSFGEIPPISDAAAASIEEAATRSGSSAAEFEVGAGRVSDAMYDVRDAALLARPDIGDLVAEVRNSGGAWDDAVTSMEDYEDMLRRLTDPVFAAIDDQRRLEEATKNYQDVIKDPESTVGDQERAMWDLVQAQMAAEESAAELPDDLQTAADHIAILGDRAGITDEGLQTLRDTIMSFDGLSAQSTIGINVVGGERIEGIDINRNVTLRHSGGPVEAGQAYNWRPGEELFIPDQSGVIVPRSEATTTGTTAVGQSGPTFVFYGDVYGDEGFRQRVREANVQNGRLGLN